MATHTAARMVGNFTNQDLVNRVASASRAARLQDLRYDAEFAAREIAQDQAAEETKLAWESDNLWEATIANCPVVVTPGKPKKSRKGRAPTPITPEAAMATVDPATVTPSHIPGTPWSVEEIRYNLANDQEWIERGILAIYRAQTNDEKNAGATTHDNGIGFTGADAHYLSSFAQQILTKTGRGQKMGTCLSPKQRDIATSRMPKYARQLWEINRGKATK